MPPPPVPSSENSPRREELLVQGLVLGGRAMKHLLRPELERRGLTSPMFWALHQLVLDGPQSVGALAGACIVTPAIVSSSGDALVAAGLVSRRESAKDRRFVVLVATARGRSVHRAVWSHVGRQVLASLDGVASSELETTVRVLERLAGAPSASTREAAVVEAA